jgi:hypothetical protein
METIEVQEKKIEEKVDSVAAVFAKRAGYDSVPWF